jgi:hypothetical protein
MPLCSKLSRLLGWMNPPANPNRRPFLRAALLLVASVSRASIAVRHPLGPKSLLPPASLKSAMLRMGSKLTLHPSQVTT